jgi:TetR/AcrR family transcriptional regulator
MDRRQRVAKKAALRRTGRPRLDGGKAPQTRERILSCAIREFAQQGYRGGRVERIVDQAGVNLRLIYHYFGGKEELYLACLERVFVELRQAEHALELRALPPVEAMRKLIDFTFDHLSRHPEFIGMVRSENQLGSKGVLRRSRLVRTLTAPLLVIIEDLLERGCREGVFRDDVDAVQFFITLQALATVHIANRSTLSAILDADLADPAWLKARRRHGHEVLFSYLKLSDER